MAAKLYIVRRKQQTDRRMSPPHNEPPLPIEALFTDRRKANAHHRRREEEEAAKGEAWPLWELLYTEGADGLRALSDFEPGVFDDWLSDHDIPDPDTIWDNAGETDPVGDYFEALGPAKVRQLYAALHQFRFFEVVEVPLIEGDYPPEQREPWENDLPAGPPVPPGVLHATNVDPAILQEVLAQITAAFGPGQPTPAGDDDEPIPF
jgi:hypothetical protein